MNQNINKGKTTKYKWEKIENDKIQKERIQILQIFTEIKEDENNVFVFVFRILLCKYAFSMSVQRGLPPS